MFCAISELPWAAALELGAAAALELGAMSELLVVVVVVEVVVLLGGVLLCELMLPCAELSDCVGLAVTGGVLAV